MQMVETKLLFLHDSYLFNTTASFLGFEKSDDGTVHIFTDQTIFYPQGGGQPYDTGVIKSGSNIFKVNEVRYDNGVVHHIGEYESGEFTEGDTLELKIDAERRILHSKLQSAGHLIDMAMRSIGIHNLIPSKGFHFPEGPNVEYEGSIDDSEKDAILVKLNETLESFINSAYNVKSEMVGKEDLAKLCYFVPPHIPEGKPIRIVSVWNDEYLPCGGTHVQNTSELKGLKVHKIKSKGGFTKVSYSIEVG